VNNATINMGVQVPLLYPNTFLQICGQEWDCWIIWQFFLVFLRRLYIAFQGECTNLHSHQQCIRFPFNPHPCKYLLLLVFMMITILIGGGLLMWFWFAFCLWPEMLYTPSCVFWPLGLLPLKELCSVHFSSFFIGSLIFGSLVFPCKLCFFFLVLGFELRAYTLSHSTSPFFVKGFVR
jgi:hypothetical protein